MKKGKQNRLANVLSTLLGPIRLYHVLGLKRFIKRDSKTRAELLVNHVVLEVSSSSARDVCKG